LELHHRAQHSKDSEKLMKCNMLGCEFKGTLTKANLLIHFIRKHCAKDAHALLNAGESGNTCRVCGKNTKSTTAFYYHALSCIDIKDLDTARRLKDLQAL
jgi:hypothetical protein